MTQQEVLDLINNFIVANGNNEITANVLNPILEEMVNQPNLLIGILSQLQTSDQSNLVNAINEVYNMFGTISDAGIRLYEGTNNPNTTPPAEYNIADFYIEKDLFNNPVKLWQYNGLIWVSMLTIYDIINDGLTGTDTTWSSEKIQEVIDETFADSQITLTTDEISGEATLIDEVLNIPRYDLHTEELVGDIVDSIGVANGLATLDSTGKIPVGQLPNSVMELKGNWNAFTNTPTLIDGVGNAGDVYEATTSGVVNFGAGNIGFSIGDFVVYGANGKWYNSPNTFPTKEVVTSAVSFTLDASYKGKTIRFTGSSIVMTVPAGLGLNFEVFLDNDTVSNIVIVSPDGTLTVFAPSGLKLVGGGTGYLTMTTTTRVSIKGDFID